MRKFDKFYDALLQYKEQYGDVKVKQKYVVDGYPLGKMVSCVRTGQRRLTEEQREKLDDIGFVWRVTNKSQDFSQVYQMLVKFVKKNGHCNVPSNFKTEDGICLGIIVNNIRSGNRKLSEQERKMLEDIGFQWRAKNGIDFNTVYELLVEYQKAHGNVEVPQRYETDNHIKLGRLVSNIRSGARKISQEQRKKLDDIGFRWSVTQKKQRN